MAKIIYSNLIKFLVGIHNLAYRLIGVLAIRENNGLHPKHDILNYYEFFINNINPADKVLDIGCGNGSCTSAVSKKASGVTGIDISQKNIAMAKKKFFGDNLEYIVGDATTYKFQNIFDDIILSNVLEHIEDRVSFLKKIKGLAPKILIRVPLLTRDWLAVYKKENGLEYKLDKTHHTEYTEESFKEEMEKAGLVIDKFYVKFGELYAVLKNN